MVRQLMSHIFFENKLIPTISLYRLFGFHYSKELVIKVIHHKNSEIFTLLVIR
jgi:hypothetical protein